MRCAKYIQLLRLDKPIGIFLLLWPTLTALWLANNGMPSWKLLGVFILGTIVMRTAGCVVNDCCDRKIDSKVTRTKQRPLAQNIIDLKTAIIMLTGLLFIALLLVSQLNSATIKLSIIAVILAMLYPLTKRFTHWPQLFLGLAFAMAIPMAFTASNVPINPTAVLLYVITVLWAMVYDTYYAMVDEADDLKIGVKSLAIFWGSKVKLFIAVIQGIIILLLLVLGYYQGLLWPYYVAIVIVAGLFIYQHYIDSFQAFRNNNFVGFTIFLAVLA
ncbi:MAG: 4-hydroxybenzoate octaprenyltransferase [Legionellales bacterium]|nr:MAG: 4-hydroxybenzoate octaprenyltransferase [Legionellales bacterium]